MNAIRISARHHADGAAGDHRLYLIGRVGPYGLLLHHDQDHGTVLPGPDAGPRIQCPRANERVIASRRG
jgi:hypothetical protein